MATRKPRKKLVKKIDTLYPVNVFDLGGTKDPCFGRLNDPKAEECRMCGDSEICSIVQSQKQKLERKRIEGKFMDEEEVKNEPDRKKINKQIRKHIKRFLGINKNAYMELDLIIADTIYSLGSDITKKRVQKMIDLLVKKKKIKYNKHKNKIKLL